MTTLIPHARAATEYVADLNDLHTGLRQRLAEAQDAYRKASETQHIPIPEFKTGDLVWLNASNIKTTRPTKKLTNQCLGPFQITAKASTHA